MAMKVIQLFFFIFLIKLAFSLASHAIPSKPKVESITSFDLKNLEGYKKGQTVKGLEKVRTYLRAYGYLNYSLNQTHTNNDHFDDALEAAVKLYQFNYHLNITGILDVQTVSQMMVPRCGFPDIINGTNLMRPSKEMANKTHDTLRNVSHYLLLPGLLRWPEDKFSLTYGFYPYTPLFAIPAVSSALERWASVSVFTFTMVGSADAADIKIGFYHGDGAPFTGPTDQLAHAFWPTVGELHFNADTPFSTNLSPGTYDIRSTALHELGHILGLGHSQYTWALMYAQLDPGRHKVLTYDDILGIQDLYNF